jgi:outer membrane lipoprotein carrier protein
MIIKNQQNIQIALLFFLGLTINSLNAQNYSKLSETNTFEKKLRTSVGDLKTFSSTFDQIKYVTYLNVKVNSSGKYYIKKPDYLRWEYTKPYNYIVKVREGKVTIDDNGENSELKVKGTKIFEQVNKILKLSMTGGFSKSEDFIFHLYESEKDFKVILTPKNIEEGLFKNYELYFEKEKLSMEGIKLIEKNDDYTLITFSEVKINEPLPNSLFY